MAKKAPVVETITVVETVTMTAVDGRIVDVSSAAPKPIAAAPPPGTSATVAPNIPWVLVSMVENARSVRSDSATNMDLEYIAKTIDDLQNYIHRRLSGDA